MTVTTYQVQNILRTYGKMLGRKRSASSGTQAAQAQSPLDQVDISSGAKRRQVINKIAQEIIGQVANQSQTQTQVQQEALTALSQEYGQTLEVFRNPDGGLRFVTVDSEDRQIVEELDQERNQALEQRLGEITRDIVDRNMIS